MESQLGVRVDFFDCQHRNTLCPALGVPPICLEAGQAEEEELAAVRGMLKVEVLEVGIDEMVVTRKEKRKTKEKERESESEKDGTVEIAVRHIEKNRPREEDGSDENTKFKQKEVSASRTDLQPIDN